MAKIALELTKAVAQREQAQAPGCASSRPVASGAGWSVSDVLCTSGPQDRPFEEQHSEVSVAIVLSGTFQYHSVAPRVLMSPGSILLGNAGCAFQCSHEHAVGDRCLAFRFTREYFDTIASAFSRPGHRHQFKAGILPASRALSPIISHAVASLDSSAPRWEELAIELAAQSLQLANNLRERPSATLAAESRVTRTLRWIERDPNADISIASLSAKADLSLYHFLRVFRSVTGLTPHQLLLRLRLRDVARRLLTSRDNVLDLALDCGFGDVSNFNRSFRAEFGCSPREFRGRAG